MDRVPCLFFNHETAVQQETDLARERWLCHSNNNDIEVKKQVLLHRMRGRLRACQRRTRKSQLT